MKLRGASNPLRISTWGARLERLVHRDHFGLYLIHEQGHRSYVMKPAQIEWEELPEFSRLPDSPSLMLPAGAIQAIAQAASDADQMPRDLLGNTREIQALSYHLEDMRRLVFNKGEIK